MELANSVRLLSEAQEAIIVAKSAPVGDESFSIRNVKMKRADYLDLHKVHTRDIHKTIDALVAALVAMRATYGIDGRGYPRTGAVMLQADAALALARGGK